jgi:hypothetical protein
MPLLYGEGRKAFLRLQKEVLAVHGDESVLAWRTPAYADRLQERTKYGDYRMLFAPSAYYFVNSVRAHESEKRKDLKYRCSLCTSNWKNAELLKQHRCLCYEDHTSAPRPMGLTARGLHAQRPLWRRPRPRRASEFFIILDVCRDTARDNEMIMKVNPVHTLCPRRSLRLERLAR